MLLWRQISMMQDAMNTFGPRSQAEWCRFLLPSLSTILIFRAWTLLVASLFFWNSSQCFFQHNSLSFAHLMLGILRTESEALPFSYSRVSSYRHYQPLLYQHCHSEGASSLSHPSCLLNSRRIKYSTWHLYFYVWRVQSNVIDLKLSWRLLPPPSLSTKHPTAEAAAFSLSKSLWLYYFNSCLQFLTISICIYWLEWSPGHWSLLCFSYMESQRAGDWCLLDN
jgi:hypothetical protein